MTPEQLNRISKDIVDVAYHIHVELGPGLREIVYERLFAKRLIARGHKVQRQLPISAVIGGIKFKKAFRPDILVEASIVVEIKATRVPLQVFERQVLTYLKATDLRLGFLINFGMPTIKQGIHRIVNRF